MRLLLVPALPVAFLLLLPGCKARVQGNKEICEAAKTSLSSNDPDGLTGRDLLKFARSRIASTEQGRRACAAVGDSAGAEGLAKSLPALNAFIPTAEAQMKEAEAFAKECAASGGTAFVKRNGGREEITCRPDPSSSAEFMPGSSPSAATTASATAAGTKLNKKESQAFLTELRALEQRGRSMESLRSISSLPDGPAKLDKIRRCGEQMRELKPRVAELRTKGPNLPDGLESLYAASIHLDLCVSCSESLASQNCADAKTATSQGASALQKLEW